MLPRLLLELPLQSRVVVVLDVVICAPRQVLGDLRPPIAIDLMHRQDLLVLSWGPLHLLDIRVQMIVPST